MAKDTLFYDGACPLCSAEISRLRKHAKDALILQDIHDLDGSEPTPHKTLLLSRLHLKTAEGEWITGLRANIRAWHHTPFRLLWRMLDWPLISSISHWFYELWLRKRNASSCISKDNENCRV
jgi:predicted DCC family thiol-disulfide oxidoreductase YuxK